jgi:hypothetical protein
MKTFEEASEIVIQILAPGERVDAHRSSSKYKALDEESQKYASLHEEIQSNPITMAIAIAIYEGSIERRMCPHEALVAAISHGVVIGIRMEKGDYDPKSTG